jgi:hypothetical protein
MDTVNACEYKCTECSKEYKAYKSLWEHNRVHHGGKKVEKVIKEPILCEVVVESKYPCRKCSLTYKHRQTRYAHEKNCVGVSTNQDIELEKMRLLALDKQQSILITEQNNLNIEQRNLKLKIKLQQMDKIDAKTFKAVNKILMERSSSTMTNSSVNSNNSNCNTQIINYNFPNITSLGRENVPLTLSGADKIEILESKMNSLEKMVELVHCGTHNQFKNIVITNLKDKFAYRYDMTKGYFTAVDKGALLEEVIAYRIMDLEAIYDELSTANKIDRRTQEIIQKFLDKLENGEVYTDDTGKYADYKSYKTNRIKVLLYNNQDKVTKDIALLLN